MVIEKNWVNRKNLGYFIFFHMKSPSYESKYIPPRKKNTFLTPTNPRGWIFFSTKKNLIFWLEVHLSFFTSARYTYTHIRIYLDFFCFHWCFFRKTKNTQLSMGICFPSFLVETGDGRMPLPGWLETRWTLRTKIQAPDRWGATKKLHRLQRGESRNECDQPFM